MTAIEERTGGGLLVIVKGSGVAKVDSEKWLRRQKITVILKKLYKNIISRSRSSIKIIPIF
jgi:hypothetical protein